MQKYILAVALCFNLSAMAPAIADPLALFVNQCLQYQPDIGPFRSAQDVEDKTLALEKSLLGLHNINDRLNYYRSLVKDAAHGQDLLLCQVHLADELAEILNNDNLTQWTHSLHLLPAPYPELAKILQRLQDSTLDIGTKSQLHTAQASVNYGLARHQISLQFNDKRCALPANLKANSQQQASSKTAKNMSLSHYLKVHPSDICRRSAWRHYQTRLKQRNKPSLEIIKKIRDHNAVIQGYNNVASLQLSQQTLTVQALRDYLQSQTQMVGSKPWDLPKALAKSPHHFTPLEGKQILSTLMTHLTELGLVIETLSSPQTSKTDTNADNKPENNSQILRVWHQGRLLGEIFINEGKVNRAYRLRQTLVGHQFGQMAISYQKNINKRTELLNLIQALSESINSLASGAPFYLVATLGQSDKNAVATEWLSLYLQQKMSLAPPSPREALLQDAKLQLAVFKNKLILHYYLSLDINLDKNTQRIISDEFNQGFGEPWDQAAEMIYNFSAIANEGISYYLPLWHRSLAELIFQQTSTLSSEDIFTVLVVNENNAQFTDQLAQLISGPVDPLSLIRRFTHASVTQE
jgi:hypothetical protein